MYASCVGMELVKSTDKQNAGGGGGMDPFAAFFGRQQNGGGDRKANKGEDYPVEISVSLDDMYNGNTVNTLITRRVVCRGCKNKPKKGICADCGQCPNEVRTVLRQVAPGGCDVEVCLGLVCLGQVAKKLLHTFSAGRHTRTCLI